MLDALHLTVAIALPWLAATLWLLRVWPAGMPGRWLACVGFGYFLAMFGVAVVLLALERVFSAWMYYPTLVASGLLALWVAWLFRNEPGSRVRGLRQEEPMAAGWPEAPLWVRVAVLALGALIAVRLGGLFMETLWRPIFGWDAWYYWTYRARAFFEHGSADAFAPPEVVLRGDESVYAHDFRHPPLVSVIQLWPALAMSRWHDALVNLPWFLTGPALGLAVVGQLLRLGVGILLAVFAAYLVLSVPLLGVHIGFGGYADIWMVGALALATLSMVALLEERRWHEMWVFLPLLCVIPFIKQAGVLFAAVLVVAVVFGALQPVWGLLLLAALGVVGAVLVFGSGLDFAIPGLGRVLVEPGRVVLPRGGELALDPQWGVFFQRLIVDGSWHLLFLVGVALVIFAIPIAWRMVCHRFLWVLVVALGVMTFVVYAGTLQASKLIDGTGFGRHLLPLVPLIAVWATLFFVDWTGVRQYTWLHRGKAAG